ncbi:MAG TPA: hypothetical protein QF624_09430 [Dehalococcoidia bacterium]|jgi:hypothetical protein|nr:hypothetical protein [Dehalococcoidia bacterium]
MSSRRETVYWHGCTDQTCESGSHGCSRVEIWIDTVVDGGAIAYIYDERIHCLACSRAKYPGPDGPDEGSDGRLVPGDEWWDSTAPGCQSLNCGTCGAVIDESHDAQSCVCDEQPADAGLAHEDQARLTG